MAGRPPGDGVAAVHRAVADGMRYRGPDRQGEYSSSTCGLFCNELRITGRDNLHQPVKSNNDQVVSALNGELYNYRNLNRELEPFGLGPQTDCDVETLNKSYLRWGPDCFERIHGIFGAAIFDFRNHSVVLARDRFGQVPLFYRTVGSVLHFATESNRLVSFGGFGLERDALLQFLAFGFSFDHLVSGIKRLKPGTYLVADASGIQERAYWKPVFNTRYDLSESQAIDTALDSLESGIEELTPRDVRFGTFVSGGIDSGIVASLLAGAHAGLPMFTSGLVGARLAHGPAPVDPDYCPVEATGNELAFADSLAAGIPVQYFRREFSVEELLADLPRMVGLLPGGPVMSTSFPPFYYAAAESGAQQIRVCLTGEGADELNGGYRTCDLDQYATGNFCRPFIAASNFFSGEEIEQLLGGDSRRSLDEICRSVDESVEAEFEGDGQPEDVLWNKVRSFMIRRVFCPHLLEKGNGMAMGSGPTELRMPFLSDDYVEANLKLPRSILQQSGCRKALQAAIAARVGLPPSILVRPKQRTSLPYYNLFFHDDRFSAFVKTVLNRRSLLCEFLALPDPYAYVESCRGRRDAHKRAWSLLVLEIWLRNATAFSSAGSGSLGL